MNKTIFIILTVFTIVGLYGQIQQQEFLDPGKVRKEYRLKDFKTILFSDEEVFEKNLALQDRKYIETSGYRIQLISTQDLHEAIKMKALADSLYNIPVYVDFEPPNYKVRIGNYPTNEEALSMQKIMKKRGFKYAWVVPGKIVVPK